MQGLVLVIEELAIHILEIEHRRSVRHIYANLKAKYSGGTMIRNLVLVTSKATYKKE